jgi:hypothetical protein
LAVDDDFTAAQRIRVHPLPVGVLDDDRVWASLGLWMSAACSKRAVGAKCSESKALNAFSRPPLATRPCNSVNSSTPVQNGRAHLGTVASGTSDQTSAATPATCGAAMLVPLAVP